MAIGNDDTVKLSFLSKLAVLPTVIFITSVIITLVGILVLSAWAETSGLAHASQHALIFLGGFGSGSSFLTLIKKQKEK